MKVIQNKGIYTVESIVVSSVGPRMWGCILIGREWIILCLCRRVGPHEIILTIWRRRFISRGTHFIVFTTWPPRDWGSIPWHVFIIQIPASAFGTGGGWDFIKSW